MIVRVALSTAVLLLAASFAPARAENSVAITAVCADASSSGPPGCPALQAGVVNWTVCSKRCDFTGPLEAWNAARRAVMFGQFASITIKVADGAYDVADQFYTDQSGTATVHLVGNVEAPRKVVFNFTKIAGTNLSGFVAERGGGVGQARAPGVDGVTLNGEGARTARTVWENQSYGAGALALGSGSNIYFGPHVVVQNFYYGVLADQGGRFVGDGGTFQNAGDSNLLARFGGVVQCLSCTLATAAHLFTNAYGAAEVLGRNALAEGSASMYIDGSNATDAEVACISAHTNASVWAHGVVAQSCAKYGAEAQQNGMIELGRSRITYSGVGAYADTGGRLNVDGLELANNRFDGLNVNGGAATGSGLKSHDNAGYGVRVLNAGRAELYGANALLLRNRSGKVHVQQHVGCTGDGGGCVPASMLIMD